MLTEKEMLKRIIETQKKKMTKWITDTSVLTQLQKEAGE